MAIEQSAGADVVEALLIAGANYDVTEKVLYVFILLISLMKCYKNLFVVCRLCHTQEHWRNEVSGNILSQIIGF